MKHYYHFLYYLCLLVSIFLLTGCIEKFEDELPQEESKLLVVQGQIYNEGFTYFTIDRSMPIKADSTESLGIYQIETVNSAKLYVKGTDGYSQQLENMYGFYYSDKIKLNPNVEYYLRIEDGGDIYESTPEKPLPTPAIDSVETYQANEKSPVDIMITTAKPENLDETIYYEWDVTETWEVQPAFWSNTYYEPSAGRFIQNPDLYPKHGWVIKSLEEKVVASTLHYPGNQFNRYKMYEIDRDNERIYYNYSGLVIQRAISKAEYEYQLACLQSAKEMGGIFSPQASTLPSNIHCVNGSKRAIGYIGISLNINDLRFFIDGEKVLGKIFPPLPETGMVINPDENSSLFHWNRGERVCKYLPPSSTQNETVWWCPAKYVDLRLRDEVTFVKPDYMPFCEYK